MAYSNDWKGQKVWRHDSCGDCEKWMDKYSCPNEKNGTKVTMRDVICSEFQLSDHQKKFAAGVFSK